MTANVNKVILAGRLGKDPEIRTMQNGGKVCSLSVATSERWKDKVTKEQKERTEWHRVVVFQPSTVDFIEKYGRKGRAVYLEGAIKTRKWQDKDGKDQYSTEIVVQGPSGEFQFQDKGEADTGGAPDRNGYHAPLNDPYGNAPAGDDGFESDIPF